MGKPILPLLMFVLLFSVLLAGCSGNPAPPGLTPIPTYGPTVELTAVSGGSGQAPTGAATAAATQAPTEAASGTPGAPPTPVPFQPPNCGNPNCNQPGPAITQNLKGDPVQGQKIFTANCAVCHGPQGQGGQPNPGSADGTVPSLNPIDEAFNPDDPTKFATHIDVFIEHGSHTDGLEQMPSWGDNNLLSPQQIADVVAYVVSLNPQ